MAHYKYEDAVKQLQESGVIGLQDFKNLSYEDLTELLEEIKVWCLYANGKLDKLPKESKKKKEKKDKKDKKDKKGWLQPLICQSFLWESKGKSAPFPWGAFN